MISMTPVFIKSGRLSLANAPVVGFSKNYRYADFTMTFHLRLENSGGAAWAVRVKDSNNYYLFYLSGPKGAYSGRFRAYIVRDGKLDLADAISAVPIPTKLKEGGHYQIKISAVGNKIYHNIISDTGVEEKLGIFEDTNNTFPIGGIGFRTVGTERFSIDDLFVQSPQKPN
jgi:hypothetical protein